MQNFNIFIISCAICNLVSFVEAGPTESDFNSNILYVINLDRTSNAGNFNSLLYLIGI